MPQPFRPVLSHLCTRLNVTVWRRLCGWTKTKRSERIWCVRFCPNSNGFVARKPLLVVRSPIWLTKALHTTTTKNTISSVFLFGLWICVGRLSHIWPFVATSNKSLNLYFCAEKRSNQYKYCPSVDITRSQKRPESVSCLLVIGANKCVRIKVLIQTATAAAFGKYFGTCFFRRSTMMMMLEKTRVFAKRRRWRRRRSGRKREGAREKYQISKTLDPMGNGHIQYFELCAYGETSTHRLFGQLSTAVMIQLLFRTHWYEPMCDQTEIPLQRFRLCVRAH